MNKKSYDEVFDYFNNNGCELLSDEYITGSDLLKFKCKCGNISNISFLNFKKKIKNNRYKCPCSITRRKTYLTYEQVYNFFENSGCKLLSKTYESAEQKLKFICRCGNVYQIIMRGKNLEDDVYCYECSRKRAVDTNKKNHNGKFYCDVEGRKKRWLKKYGVDNPLKSEKIQEKRKLTCLNKYGVEYASQSDITKENQRKTFMKRYGVEYGHQNKEIRKKFEDTILKRYNVPNLAFLTNVYSKESQKLFWAIQNRLEFDMREKSYFGELNKEYVKKRKGKDEYYKYDFVNSRIKKCIEYNGSSFHPKSYQNDNEINWCVFHPNRTVKEAREYEKRKYDTIKEYGYDVLVVWDYEIKENGMEKITNKCLKFLLK